MPDDLVPDDPFSSPPQLKPASDEPDEFDLVLDETVAAPVEAPIPTNANAEPIATRQLLVPPEAEGQRIDVFLTQVLDGFSRVQIRRAIQEGGAEIAGKVIRPSHRVRAGQQVQFKVPPNAEPGPLPEPILLDVLYEDDGIIVINKPAGMVVHPAKGHWSGTLTSALAYRFSSLSDVGGPTRPGIVHRLDRDTSGVILVAKTNAVHMNLAAQFEARTVRKTYMAITSGVPDRDRDWIDQPIGPHPYQRDKMAIRGGHPMSREAQTFYEVLQRFRGFACLKLAPKTGRTHQIRVHLEFIRCPILCDRLYSGRSEISLSQLQGKGLIPGTPIILNRQALHAAELEIDHPHTGKRMKFSAPLPPDFESTLQILKAD